MSLQLRIPMTRGYVFFVFFPKYDCKVMRVFQIREHHPKIVKLGRYAMGNELVQSPCIYVGSHETPDVAFRSTVMKLPSQKRCEIFTDGQHSCSTALFKA